MEQKSKNTDKNTDKRLKNLRPPWKKGDPSPNPTGHPKGQRNYATIYKEAMIMLAEKNNTTPEALENEMIANGAVLARKGDYRFYKDTLDRLHGTPVQRQDHTTDGEKITFMPSELLNKHHLDTNTGTKSNSEGHA